MLGTTPSATNCRAISRQSQKDKERPRSSGRSQAILTRCSATSGGKDRRAAGSGLVVKSGESVAPEPFGPLADVPHAQAAEPGGLRQGLALFEQEQDTAPACQPGVASRRALPVLDLGAVFRGQSDGQGGFAAPHGDTEVSGCMTKGKRPTSHHDRQDRREWSIRYPFSAALYLGFPTSSEI